MKPTPTILITGAAQRVGRAIAHHLHQEGANIAIHFRHSTEAAESLCSELNAIRENSADIFAADLLCTNTLAPLVHNVHQRFGTLDALINNASSFYPTPIGTITEPDWDDLIGSNLKAPLFLSQAAAPLLKEQRGCIINITDIHSERPNHSYSVYCAAKAGLAGLTRALAVDLAPAIRVNAIAPGAILWPEQGELSEPDAQTDIINHSLMKRAGTPEDIAKTCQFILQSDYITGQILNVDGGRSICL